MMKRNIIALFFILVNTFTISLCFQQIFPSQNGGDFLEEESITTFVRSKRQASSSSCSFKVSYSK
jgi:hypothetical protein